MFHKRFGHSPPPWWPADEPWPPADSPSRRRGSFFWRVGGLLLLLFCLAFGWFTFLFWTLVTLPNSTEIPHSPVAFIRPWTFIVFPVPIIILIVALRMLRRVTLPLGELVQAAERVAAGDYTTRVREWGPRDVAALARTFNSMVERLQANETQRRHQLAEVTHELRTPLTVVQGNLEGLVDGIYPLDREHLEPILEETRLLSRLIEDLRTLALVESGTLKLQKEPTDLPTLLGETVASFRPQADAAGIQMQVEAAPDSPLAPVDPARIRQVLANILSNALRYTPPGGKIRVQSFVEIGQEKQFVISISDTGAGISRQDLPHIFDRSYKSPDSHGSGLGLTIAKNLVNAHGGEMTADSSLGQGTTIRLTLPLLTT